MGWRADNNFSNSEYKMVFYTPKDEYECETVQQLCADNSLFLYVLKISYDSSFVIVSKRELSGAEARNIFIREVVFKFIPLFICGVLCSTALYVSMHLGISFCIMTFLLAFASTGGILIFLNYLGRVLVTTKLEYLSSHCYLLK